jgi:hypothetical protein
MSARLHLIKLCVGCDAVEELIEWQAARSAEARARGLSADPCHVTRMWPKREAEILDGGSLYWVIKGRVLARQRLRGLEAREGADGISRCALRLDPEIVRTVPAPRRPFQGWRYLRPEDAPADLGTGGGSTLPPELAASLAELGVL